MTEPRWPVRLGAGLAVPVGALAGLLEVALAGKALADCDVGINASANSFGLVLVLPIVMAVDVAAFGVVFAVSYRAAARVVRPERRWVAVGAALLAGLLTLALLAWAWMALAVSADYPDPICPDNIPPWWPSWLPV